MEHGDILIYCAAVDGVQLFAASDDCYARHLVTGCSSDSRVFLFSEVYL